MSYKIKVGVLITTLIIVSASLGATAYTTGSVSRTTNANVVTDDVGLIALEAGTVGSIVQQNSTGALAIDFTAGGNGAQGVNTEAHFELGDPGSPTTSYAFNVTNLDGETHSFTYDYTGTTNATADGNDNIQFQLYNSTGGQINTMSEETGGVSVNSVAPGETTYVVIVVDTHGLNSTADLSGTLQVSA